MPLRKVNEVMGTRPRWRQDILVTIVPLPSAVKMTYPSLVRSGPASRPANIMYAFGTMNQVINTVTTIIPTNHAPRSHLDSARKRRYSSPSRPAVRGSVVASCLASVVSCSCLISLIRLILLFITQYHSLMRIVDS